MLPGGFKKDSRVWLHKNAHVFPKKPLNVDPYTNTQRPGSDDPYDQTTDDPLLNPTPFITDASGRVFKKDSRTWLHKSSLKKLARAVTNGAIKGATVGKVSWRQQPPTNFSLSGGEAPEGLIRTRSSTEMLRTQTAMFKIKKKKKKISGFNGQKGLPPTLDSRSVKEISIRPHAKQPGASYHWMSMKKGSCEVSAYASDFCIVGEKNSSAAGNASSSSDTENDEDDDDSVDATYPKTRPHTERGPVLNYPPCCVDDGGFIGVGYNTNTVEITKDGLRELERMMKEQSHRRSSRPGTLPFGVLNNSLAHDVSPQSSESRASLDACINLSEEFH